MDLVSIETPDEYEWLKQRIGSKFYIILKGANTTGAASTDTARVSLCAWEHSPLGHAVSPVQANKQYVFLRCTSPGSSRRSLKIQLFLFWPDIKKSAEKLQDYEAIYVCYLCIA